MIKVQLIAFLIFCVSFCEAQNIILNSSFEDTVSVQFGAKFAKNWKSPTKGSPDYLTPFHPINFGVPQNYTGFQYAKTGKAYMGILIYSLYANNDIKRYREYIQTKFRKSLKKDSSYCFQLFISLADSIRFASKNKIGIYFSNNQISSNDFYYLPVTPQIMVSPDTFITEKDNWLEYNFEYIAVGGEDYITIGNFTDSTEIDTLKVDGGVRTRELSYSATYYYIDDLYLGHCDSLPLDTPSGIAKNSLLSKIKGYPNPVKEQFILENNSTQQLEFQLYNLMGSKFVTNVQQNHNKYRFSMGHLPKGIYLLTVIAEGERVMMKLIKD